MEKILESIWEEYVYGYIEYVSPLSDQECKETDKQIEKILKDLLHISQCDKEELDLNIDRISAISEHRGFINGLKVGVMLAKELGVSV